MIDEQRPSQEAMCRAAHVLVMAAVRIERERLENEHFVLTAA